MTQKKTKISKAAAIFLIVMTVLSFANFIRIEIDGSLLKLAGLVVIIGVVAFFVTRGTNDSKDEGLDIKTVFSKMKSKKVIILALIAIGTMFIKNKEKYFKKLREADVKFI